MTKAGVQKLIGQCKPDKKNISDCVRGLAILRHAFGLANSSDTYVKMWYIFSYLRSITISAFRCVYQLSRYIQNSRPK